MIDPAMVKLGRRPARLDRRNLRLAHYLAADIPTPPDTVDYGASIKDWGMLANDQLGDCTCAGILHMIMLWNAENGVHLQFRDGDAIKLYEQLCGYDPRDPNTDQGGIELDILKSWRKMPIYGTSLLGFASVDPTNWKEVRLAHWLAGSLYMGLSLPVSAQNETIWSHTSDTPGGWGGHCTISNGYGKLGGFNCSDYLSAVTWGTKQRMTPRWLAKYCDELYAPITPSWFNKSGIAPNMLNLEQLKADIAACGQLTI